MPPDASVAATTVERRAPAVMVRRAGRTGRLALGAAVTAIYVFLLAPVAIIVFSSFNPTEANTFPPTGFSLRWYAKFLDSAGFVGAFRFSLWLALVLICLPFAIACIVASLEGIDAQLELAALTLGASRLRALWEVVLPLVAPGLLSALLFAFMVSFGDVYIALFLSGPGRTTLPIEVFSYMQWESTPVVAAITTVQILLIIGLGLVIERLVGLRKIMRV